MKSKLTLLSFYQGELKTPKNKMLLLEPKKCINKPTAILAC